MSIPLAQIPPATGFHFSGATAANVNLQRSASAQRNLPQHAPRSTLAGPHRTPSARRPGTGSAPAAPAATAPSILDIAIIPAKLAMGAKHGPVPGFHLRVTQADVSQLVTALRKCDLCFEVSLAEFSPSAVLWTHIHAKVTEHLALHNLALPISPSEPSSSSVTDFHTLPWIVVEKGRKAGDGYKLAIAGNLNGHDLTVAYLRSAKAVPNPSGKDRALLLLAPRHSDMALPLTSLALRDPCACHDLPLHVCAPFRILRTYMHFDKNRNTDESWFECQDFACPPCTPCGRGVNGADSAPTVPAVPAPTFSAAAPPPRPISAAAPSVALPVQSLSAAHRPPAASASSTMPGHIPTTPPLQPTVSRIHHRSPQSQLDANPGARSRRRIGSVSQSDIAPLSLMGLATGSSTTLTPTVASLALHGRASSSSTPHNSTPVLPLLHPSTAVDSAESSDSDLPSISDIIAEDAHKRSQVEIPLPSPPSPLHSDLENWFTGNESGRTTEPVPGNVPEFEGTSIASLATAFLDFLVYSHCHPLQWTWADWPLPDGVTKFSVFAVGDYLKQPVRLFRAGPAAGQGVGHAVLVHALQLMTGNAAFWADSVGGYKRPVFLDNGTTNIRRVDTWKAFGALCGMYMVDTGVAPTPVSPFLVLTALLATAALDSGLEFVDPAYTAAVVRPIMQLPVLVGFDSELAATFAPWLMLPWDEPIPQGHLAPARQFIIQVLETNVVEVASSRTAAASQAVHEGWTFQAYFWLLFGDKSSILGLREFIAFREGLAVPVPVLGHDTSVPLLKTITELVDIEDLPLFILAMYDRGISDVTAFIEKHINYHIIRAADNKDSLPPAEFNKRRLAQKLFRLRFNRYLHGRGHPNHPVLSLLKTGRLSAGQFAAEATSSTVRATTLLKAVTDSSMVPVDPYWQIHIGFQVPEDVKQKGAFFKIATCTGNLTVIMTLDLIRMLTHTPASAEEATEFDAVVHQMLYGAAGDYSVL
ncbi:hypothetical protein L227DRAFT_617238 [Lentinus tigrinus ALCF2SS1-6]|uniref:Uncharacterized protein n=1 Tax=Lentinus tigrinus ALCF2SS1-6 TaxID=1328759 RepID=A0A5C2RP49_9APHY|nr:hypothetical protein L227DRAFT_617238 [Lentinus tigrinus ALCF2SS1-6]